jgi:hypothetical protein
MNICGIFLKIAPAGIILSENVDYLDIFLTIFAIEVIENRSIYQ